MIEVVVEGGGASVVVGVEEVGGAVEVIVVVSGAGAAVVWPVGAGAGASDPVGPGAEDVAELELLDVPVGLLEVPAPVNFTTAWTRSARTTAVSTPSPTRAAGRWYQGGVGAGYWPYPVGSG